MRESDVERYLVREVERRGGLAPKWVSPGNNGVPDRLVILPGGRTLFVETKAPDGRMKALQRRWARELTERGHHHAALYTREDVDRWAGEVFGG